MTATAMIATMLSMSARNDGLVSPLILTAPILQALVAAALMAVGVIMVVIVVVVAKVKVVGTVVIAQRQSWRCTQW